MQVAMLKQQSSGARTANGTREWLSFEGFSSSIPRDSSLVLTRNYQKNTSEEYFSDESTQDNLEVDSHYLHTSSEEEYWFSYLEVS